MTKVSSVLHFAGFADSQHRPRNIGDNRHYLRLRIVMRPITMWLRTYRFNFFTSWKPRAGLHIGGRSTVEHVETGEVTGNVPRSVASTVTTTVSPSTRVNKAVEAVRHSAARFNHSINNESLFMLWFNAAIWMIWLVDFVSSAWPIMGKTIFSTQLPLFGFPSGMNAL